MEKFEIPVSRIFGLEQTTEVVSIELVNSKFSAQQLGYGIRNAQPLQGMLPCVGGSDGARVMSDHVEPQPAVYPPDSASLKCDSLFTIYCSIEKRS